MNPENIKIINSGKAQKVMGGWQNKTAFSIYIHYPFCLKKCPYCDFNSHVREEIDNQRFLQAYLAELDYYFHYHYPVGTVRSVFFGGGTPSLMPDWLVAGILEHIAKRWQFGSEAEITLEANPTSSEQKNFRLFRSAGINRLSIGVQSLNAEYLQFLGREHSADEAIRAVTLAAEIFPRFSFDLIYALYQQTSSNWQQELQSALAFGAEHMSLYQLTIEPNTVFSEMYSKRRLKIIDDDQASDLYQMTNEIMAQHNMYSYEISNYAISGQESAHNLCYWNYQPYIGVGAGAHGRIMNIAASGKISQAIATTNHSRPEKWLELWANSNGAVDYSHNYQIYEPLDNNEMIQEYVLMKMRLAKGISEADLLARLDVSFEQVFDMRKIESYIGDGMINLHHDADMEGKRIAISDKGRIYSEYLIADLFGANFLSLAAL